MIGIKRVVLATRPWGVALLVSLMFVIGVGIGRHATGPLDRAALIVKAFTKGSDKVAQELLAPNYKKTDQVTAPAIRTVDTSRLPLTLTEIKLDETGLFASGRGGSVVNINGTLFAMDRLGNIFTFKENALERMDYGDLPSNLKRFVMDAGSWLVPNAFKAHFMAYDATSSILYVSHQRFNTETKRERFAISALAIDRASFKKMGDWELIFESEDISHTDQTIGAGGKMVIFGDTLYFTVGDYASDKAVRQSEFVAQDPKSSFGKIFELDIRSRRITMKAMGFRNPQGLVYTTDGKLIDAEHGPEGGDELNIIADGKNYGWPYKTYGTTYGHFSWLLPAAAPTDANFAEPLFSWVPSAAISAIIQVHDFHEAWDGDLLVGSLKAQSLYRLKFVEDRIIFSEPIWIGHRVRDIAQIGAQLVLMTDDPSLIFINIDSKRLQGDSRNNTLVELNPSLQTCVTCHHFGPTNPSHMAPSLSNILQRDIASDDFDKYSDGLKSHAGKWTETTIASFLKDPAAFAPGTGMPNLKLGEEEVQNIVHALQSPSR